MSLESLGQQAVEKSAGETAVKADDEQRYQRWWEAKVFDEEGEANSFFEMMYDEADLVVEGDRRYVVDHKQWTPDYQVDERYAAIERRGT